MSIEFRPARPGETIAYRGDGATLVFDYNEDDLDWGHIVMQGGTEGGRSPLVSLLSHGGWTAEPVTIER